MNRHQLIHELDRVISKSKAVNKPYQAIKRTDEYKNVQSLFTDGIGEQGSWASKNITKLLESAGIDDNGQELGIDQVQQLTGLVKRDMPPLSEFVSEFKVFQNLKGFFEWGVKQQYKRWGYIVKSAVSFELTNTEYINALKNRAAYLLNQSSLDDTTLNQIIDIISQGKQDGLTNDELAGLLSDEFDAISRDRGEMIARTESANALGSANYASAKENGAATKYWVGAGSPTDELCIGNIDDGEIPIDQPFSSGDMYEPAHPNCECYTEAGEIDLDSIDIWGGE